MLWNMEMVQKNRGYAGCSRNVYNGFCLDWFKQSEKEEDVQVCFEVIMRKM